MGSEYAYRKGWYTKLLEQPSSYYMEPFCIAGNLYFIGNKDSASHLVDTGDGLIVFDTGYPHMSGLLIASIYECGFSTKDIRMIFHTHGHFDHFGATKLLTTLSGAKTYIGAREAKMFAEQPEYILADYLDGVPVEMFAPDVLLTDGDEVTLGGTTVRAIATPGHSAGAMTYRFNVSGGDREYTAVLAGGSGFNTLCRDFMELHGNWSWRDEFAESLAKWQEITCDIYLGNHTPQSETEEKRRQMREGNNPFIDAEALKRFASDVERRYRRMLSEEGKFETKR